MHNFMTKSVEHLKSEAKSLQEKFQENTRKIRQVCSNCFNKYELDLEELKIRISNLQDKYKGLAAYPDQAGDH